MTLDQIKHMRGEVTDNEVERLNWLGQQAPEYGIALNKYPGVIRAIDEIVKPVVTDTHHVDYLISGRIEH